MVSLGLFLGACESHDGFNETLGYLEVEIRDLLESILAFTCLVFSNLVA